MIITFLKSHRWSTVFILFVFFTAVLSVTDLIIGNIPFWYDPARDFLIAWDNLHKLTLIGPTTGIPGLFYGPYWIWLLSFGQLFSKNPRIVIFIILSLPYFIVFPYILFKYQKVFGYLTVTLLWLLFYFSFARIYSIQAWNPNLAPLLFLLVITSFIFPNKEKLLSLFISGLLVGLLTNFHISFGSTVIVGSCVFILISHYFSSKRKISSSFFTKIIQQLFIFLLGVAVTFLPFFLFEIRHGFMQTKTLIATLTANHPVVGAVGLTKLQILQEIAESFATLTALPLTIASIVLLLGAAYVVYGLLKKKLTEQQKKLALLLICYCVSLLIVYLTAKNPVWGYHFVGLEILFLLLVGLVLAKSTVFRASVGIWVLFLIISNTNSYIHSVMSNPLNGNSLVTKEYITNTVIKDADSQPYTVYVYNPSIYTYDFSYLFRWLGSKDVPYDPGNIHPTGLVYLIIPKTTKNVYNNFIGSRTPDSSYKTANVWIIPDGSRIVKRVKK